MPVYYLLHAAAWFHQRARPALAAAWDRRSFEPCRPLCAGLLPAAADFARRYHAGPDEPLLRHAAEGLPFERSLWRGLVGEVLLYGAAEVPELQIAPDTLCCLLAPEQYRGGAVPRERFAPIQQAHYGARDLTFGGACYRPEHAGWNDTGDVARLAEYLTAVDPGRWTTADLAGLRDVADEDERAEELEYAREWFPALSDLYRQAEGRGRVVVCEIL